MPEQSRTRGPGALSSAWHPASRDHHTQERQNPPGNMILLHFNSCFNNFILFPFSFPALPATLQDQSCVCPKSSSFSLTPSSISIDLFEESRGKFIAQDIFHFNFTVSITHSSFGKAQGIGNTLLLKPLPLDPLSPLPSWTPSAVSHTTSYNPSVEPKRDLGMANIMVKVPFWLGFQARDHCAQAEQAPWWSQLQIFQCISLSPSPNTFSWIWTMIFWVWTKYGKISAPRGSFSKQSTYARWSQRKRDIHSLPTARTSKFSQRGFPWLERHHQPK